MGLLPEDRLTLATDFLETEMAADPVRPSEAALMLTLPMAKAVTIPSLDTVATEVSLVDHPMLAVGRELPIPSLATASNWKVSPTVNEPLLGVTLTDPTDGTTSGGGVVGS